MCGIAGVLSLKGKKRIPYNLIEKMIGSIQHRGPDESGIYIDDRIGLGHARLSIIDLSSGTQPIHNEDETLWIIYNGEVFNYPELKEELIGKGHTFYTTSDTEVILHLYEEHGSSCLDYLNGQFAIAIWDSKEKEFFLARDRVGIRPVYYTIQSDSLLFASEVKAIFMDRNIPREIDPVAMDQIFTFWTTLPGRTVFKGIKELPPGHFLKVSEGQVVIRKYWDIPFLPVEEHINWSSEDISQRIQELLDDAVRIRLRADVPVGCYLSGGLDSSGITAMVIRNHNSNTKTFGIRFEEDNYDESNHQEIMVSYLNANHRALITTNAMIGESFSETLWHCEKPLLRTAPVPLFLLSKLVNSSDIKVVITGEGADEIFGGYNIFRETKIRKFMAEQPGSRTRPLLIGRLYPYIFNNPRLNKIMLNFFSQGLDRKDDPFFSHIIRWNNTSKLKNFFSNDLKKATNPEQSLEELRRTLPDNFKGWDYLCKAQYLEVMLFLSNYLLSSQGDRVAMAHSLEIRLPYLDYRIIDFMSRVPSKLKIRALNEKYILKKSFNSIVPKEIYDRPKHPYRAPIIRSLLNEKTWKNIGERLSDRALENGNLFDVKKVKNLLKKIQSVENRGEVDSMSLAGIISSQIIFEQFIENFDEYAENRSRKPKIMKMIDRSGLV